MATRLNLEDVKVLTEKEVRKASLGKPTYSTCNLNLLKNQELMRHEVLITNDAITIKAADR